VDDPLGTRSLGCVEHVDGPAHVHRDELLHRAPLAHERRGVDDQLRSLQRRRGRGCVRDVRDAELGGAGGDPRPEARVDIHRDHLRALGGEAITGCRADEAAGASHGRAPPLQLDLAGFRLAVGH
jgi:hypothetical protein